MQKTAFPRSSTSCLFLFVFLIIGAMFVPSAMAAVQVGDNLYLFGDFRFRYEIDDEKNGNPDRDRDRARLRARFGFKYDWSKNVSFGLRLRTESDNNQSPHQTLGIIGTTDNTQFGLDRAYVEMKFLDNGFFWLGKHGISWWQQNEAFWDGDIQPEGAGGGYKFNLGPNGTLTLQGIHSYLIDNSFAGAPNGVFEDDTASTVQGVYSRSMGAHSITIATGALFVADKFTKSIPGGSTTYGMTSFQYKNKSLIPNIPIKVGFDYLYSSYNDSVGAVVSATDTTGIGVDDANEGYVVNFAANYGNWGFKFEHYRIELNAVPAQGLLAQDDFRFSSNFEGQKYQLSYKFGKGYSMDLRAYPQTRLDDSVAGPGVGAGYVQGVHRNTRYQANLNIKF